MTPGSLYAAGLGLREVAKQYRVSHETVRLWISFEGVPMRPMPETLRRATERAAKRRATYNPGDIAA
jgi:uncharacterized protein YjcR